MRRHSYHTLLVSNVALVMALAQPALAQEVRGPESPQPTSNAPSPAGTATVTPPGTPGAAQSTEGLTDIVVTARKVAENLQSVPVSITALSGDALQQQGARQVSDVALLTPGLVVLQSPSAGSSATFTLRGQVQADNSATVDPSVGVYVDGLYIARAYGINANLLDVQSVQTLRGPQGTLFGRNTTGGAILIDTNNPSFAHGYSVLGSASYGRFNYDSETAIVNAPLIDDVLAVRVAYQRDHRDGYVNEPNTGAKLGNVNDYTFRAKVLFKPVDNLSILLSGEQFRTSFLNDTFRGQYFSQSSPANIEAGVESTGGACFAGGLAACFGAGIGALATAVKNANSGDTDRLNEQPAVYAKTNTYSGTVTLDTFFGAIKAIGGYRRVRASEQYDLDGTPYNILASAGREDLKQLSGELQVTGKALQNKIDFAGGLFVFSEKGVDASYAAALPALVPSIQSFYGYIKNNSQGIYGQASWHVTDALALTGGLRYSIDDKRLIPSNGGYTAGNFVGPAPGAMFICGQVTCPEYRSASFGGVSYTAGVDYKLSRDVLAYAKTARGFRSGGQNNRGSDLVPGGADAFGPEQATSYEGGLKSELFDRHLRLNIGGYYTIDKNIQRTATLSGPTGATSTLTVNAGRADFYGGEVEAQAVLPGGFGLAGTAGYTHPKYIDFTDKGTGIDRRSERFFGVARWSASVSPSWKVDMGFGSLQLRSDVSYQSSLPLANNSFAVSTGALRDVTSGAPVSATDAANYLKYSTDQAHVLVDGRATLSLMQDKLEVAVWGRNLTNKRDLTAALLLPALGYVSAIRREPRMFGVTATIKLNSIR